MLCRFSIFIAFTLKCNAGPSCEEETYAVSEVEPAGMNISDDPTGDHNWCHGVRWSLASWVITWLEYCPRLLSTIQDAVF